MLPIQDVSDAICQQLNSTDVILKAPPGAGKSTYLPLQLLKQKQFSGQRILLLQPRRVAVKTIAHYLSRQWGDRVGQTVGYRIKGETKVSTNTRLEVVTEGVLVRMLQADPELSGVGLVIFDEFHERSLAADFALALCADVRQGLRDDLRLLVMSATLDGIALDTVLPAAKTIESEGRQYPIDICYRGSTAPEQMVMKIRQLILSELPEHQGNILVFLPSQRMIMALADGLGELPNHWQVCPLFGGLPLAEQQRAIDPPESGQKIVIATNIAETSLTIQGINLVIDAGLVNQSDFHLRSGNTRLSLQAISQASSTQRSGRAGRLGPGQCFRMWAQEGHHRRRQQTPAAIYREDVTDIVLQALVWGCSLADLPMLEQPSEAQLSYAYSQLRAYKAIDLNQKLTPLGHELAAMATALPMASALLYAQKHAPELLSVACGLVALMDSREKNAGVDMQSRVESLFRRRQGPVWASAQEWHKRLGCSVTRQVSADAVAILLLHAYPQRVACRSGEQRYQLASGAILVLKDSPLAQQEWLVVSEIFSHGKADNDIISAAAAVSFEQVKAHCTDGFSVQRPCVWRDNMIRVSEQQRYGRIVYRSTPASFSLASDEEKQAVWQALMKDRGLDWLPWTAACDFLLQRIQLAAQWSNPEDWPIKDKQDLIEHWLDWLWPAISSLQKLTQVQSLNIHELIKQQLDWQQQQQLEQWFPSHYTVPTGTRAPLRYENNTAILSVRIQEVFGLTRHPCIADGRLPLTVELLSPAQRPIQTTSDLPAFWAGSYEQVKKEMKGRYIRHFWPDDPATAVATNRTKKKM